jgi:multiple sugar transport system permease protein
MSSAEAARPTDDSEGMSYLSTLPQRVVRVYIPLLLIVFVLLFPFYWMAMTAVKPKEHLLDLDAHNPFWAAAHVRAHLRSCCSRPTIRSGCGTRCSSRCRPRSCR